MSDDLYDLTGLAASLEAALERRTGGRRGHRGGRSGRGARRCRRAASTATSRRTRRSSTPRRAGRAPRELAEAVGARWKAGAGAGVCDRFEVAGPGFLNLFLTDAWYRGALGRHARRGRRLRSWRAAVERRRQKINVEFVSVNPTGPLHVGHARYASYGDALCRILAFVGHDVTREFYVNDYGHADDRASASRSRPATRSGSASTRRCPKTATRATTSSTSPTSSSPRSASATARRSRRSPRRRGAAGGGGRRAQALGSRRHARPVPRHPGAPARALRRVDAREQPLRRRRSTTAASAARSASRSPTSTPRVCSTSRGAPAG